MNVLKKLGCSFSLDDFGSGLSSFSYLNSLPVDYLKIDGAFVMDIDKDPMHYAMVKSINEVGQVMGIKTIAEFAASDSIIRSLREVGVDNAQGYAIARPIPLASLTIENKPTLTAVKNK
jgi:Amt family ammonium transporter